MIRKFKMLILKLVFSPIWLLTLLFPLVYVFLYGIDCAFSRGDDLDYKKLNEEFKYGLKDMLKDIFEYWRL